MIKYQLLEHYRFEKIEEIQTFSYPSRLTFSAIFLTLKLMYFSIISHRNLKNCSRYFFSVRGNIRYNNFVYFFKPCFVLLFTFKLL